jgi:hypothetical protein
LSASLDASDPNTLIGRTLVLHEDPDDCSDVSKCNKIIFSHETESSGKRIAQCVIGHVSGNAGYLNKNRHRFVPRAICVFSGGDYLMFEPEDDQWGTTYVTRTERLQSHALYLWKGVISKCISLV